MHNKRRLVYNAQYLGYTLKVYDEESQNKAYRVEVLWKGQPRCAISMRRKRRVHGSFRKKYQAKAKEVVRSQIETEKRQLKEAIKNIEWEVHEQLHEVVFYHGYRFDIYQDVVTKKIEYEVSRGFKPLWRDVHHFTDMDECLKCCHQMVDNLLNSEKRILRREILEIERERREAAQ